MTHEGWRGRHDLQGECMELVQPVGEVREWRNLQGGREGRCDPWVGCMEQLVQLQV